jgi:hypothetical protein
MPLQDIIISNAAIREKPYKLTDGRGLFVLIHPNGSKYWRYRYRFAGKQKLLALGVYPQTSLSDARKALKRARAQLQDGIDPSAERQARKREAKVRAEYLSQRRKLLQWYANYLGELGKGLFISPDKYPLN